MDEKELLRELERLDQRLTAELRKLLENNTKAQVLNFIDTTEFNNLILTLGGAKLIENLSSSLDTILFETVKKRKLSESSLTAIEELSTRIRDSRGRTILGYFQSNTEQFKSGIYKSIVAGKTKKETAEIFFKNFNITDPKTDHILTYANIQTQIQTAYVDHQRILTQRAFADTPEQRFRYVGGIVSTSSDICAWLVENQAPDGYTAEEINSGISTPYGDVNFYGRIPNYNCGHTWEAI
jgi:hypothetical protein